MVGNRNFSFITADAIPSSCGFGCAVTYNCYSGYATVTGANAYVATCESSATLEPGESCVCKSLSIFFLKHVTIFCIISISQWLSVFFGGVAPNETFQTQGTLCVNKTY